MVYLSFPYMYKNLLFNNYIKGKISYYRTQKKSIFKFPFELEMTYGSFPFSYWNGDLNNNYDGNSIALYQDIDSLFSQTLIPICCDCSNINLDENDIYDTHQNIILQLGNSAGNFIELSDLGLLDYIQTKYKYNFIFSNKADLINPITSDIINTINEQNIFYLISLPNHLKLNIEELNKIKNKNKILITIKNKCPYNCLKQQECMTQEQINQFSYSGYTMYNCKNLTEYNDENEILNEIDFFKRLGFSHFKIDSPIPQKNQIFKLYLIQNLVKSEYQLQILNELSDFGAM